MAHGREILTPIIQAELPKKCRGKIVSAEIWDSDTDLEGLDGVINVNFECPDCNYGFLGCVLLGKPTVLVKWFFPVDTLGGDDNTRTSLEPPNKLCIKKLGAVPNTSPELGDE